MMTAKRSETFPIMTWYGPNLDKFTLRNMKYLAEGDFDIAMVVLRRDQLVSALDIAQEVGVKLMINVVDLIEVDGLHDEVGTPVSLLLQLLVPECGRSPLLVKR